MTECHIWDTLCFDSDCDNLHLSQQFSGCRPAAWGFVAMRWSDWLSDSIREFSVKKIACVWLAYGSEADTYLPVSPSHRHVEDFVTAAPVCGAWKEHSKLILSRAEKYITNIVTGLQCLMSKVDRALLALATTPLYYMLLCKWLWCLGTGYSQSGVWYRFPRNVLNIYYP